MAGKGSKARPKSIGADEFASNWENIFNKVASAAEDAADIMSDYTQRAYYDGTNFDLAGDFMKAFGQEVLTKPKLPSAELAKLRLELIREEVEELNAGVEGMDIVEIADALADILYVVYGAGHAFGLDLDACYREVHDSNMSKLGKDGKPIYRDDGKVMKGPNYRPPSLARFCQ